MLIQQGSDWKVRWQILVLQTFPERAYEELIQTSEEVPWLIDKLNINWSPGLDGLHLRYKNSSVKLLILYKKMHLD